jgi:heterodisulfide reductase subunit A
MNIAIIFCSCRNAISRYIDLEPIRKEVIGEKDVVAAKILQGSCSIGDQESIVKVIKEKQANALIFVGCSPQYYEKQFQDIFFKNININPGMIKFVNIREQLVWVHKDQTEIALREKAMVMIRAALAEVRASKPIGIEKITNLKSALVIGGGISGMYATISLANQGFHVDLVEKSPYLGGRQLLMSKAFPRDDCSSCSMAPLINNVARLPNVRIHTNSVIKKVKGRSGHYMVTITQNPRYIEKSCTNCGQCMSVCPQYVENEYNYGLDTRKTLFHPTFGAFPIIPFINERDINYCRDECKQLCTKVCDTKSINLHMTPQDFEIETGAIITAIGYDMYQPDEYGYGTNRDILTIEQFERLLVSNGVYEGKVLKPSNRQPPKSIGFILCVGARQSNKVPYCSRYCCMATATAIKQAIEVLPNTKIYVFYRDIYAMGKSGEDYIKEVQAMKNVEWIRTIPEFIPDPEGKEINLQVYVAGGKLIMPFDMLVLVTPMVPNKDTEQIREIMGLSKTPEGYFKESDPLFSPIETYEEGKILAGSCIGPRTINECVVDGYAAASSVSRLLSGEIITQFVKISDVDKKVCGGCGICVKTCLFHACSIDETNKLSITDPSLCRGCGNCVAACPSGARDLLFSPTQSIYNYIDQLAKYKPPTGPKILGMLCEGCAYPAADTVGLSGLNYPINISSIRVPCSCRIDPRFVLHGLEQQFDGVLIGACHPENCQYIGGNYDMERRMDLLKTILQTKGISEQRVRVLFVSYLEGNRFKKDVEEFINILNK